MQEYKKFKEISVRDFASLTKSDFQVLDIFCRSSKANNLDFQSSRYDHYIQIFQEFNNGTYGDYISPSGLYKSLSNLIKLGFIAKKRGGEIWINPILIDFIITDRIGG